MDAPEKPKHSPDEVEKQKHSSRGRFFPFFFLGGIIVLAVGYGLLMLFVFSRMGSENPNLDMVKIGFLGFVPIGMGAISTFALPPERRTIPRVLGLSVITTFLFLVVTGITASGLILCLIMIAPFVLIMVAIGALIIYAVRKIWTWGRGEAEKRKRQYVFAGFLLILPLLVTPIEQRISPPSWMRTTTDSIIIEGTPETVWNNIIRMETIPESEQRPSFYHTMGIPRPIRATLSKEDVGGIRQGEFEFGLMFYETITVWEPNERVRFDVDVHQNPQSSPVLMQIGGKYFDILEAGYQIEVIDSTHVRLTLDSTYRLSTNFNFYGAFWSDWIMHDFQSYVLQTVKARVEGRQDI